MIINGPGYSDRPISLTLQFSQGEAIDTFIREAVTFAKATEDEDWVCWPSSLICVS